MHVRDAVAADIGAITAIHNDAVRHTAAIWTSVTVDEADRLAWLAARQADGFPVLVAETDDGAVAGYATYGPYHRYEGYRHTVEHSVYVASGARGGGIGRALLEAVVAHARDTGRHVIVAAIEGDNAASIRLHERVGFVPTGRIPHAGTKFGRWLDVVYMVIVLDERDAPPDPH